ncbi:30S ribosomal protein S16 [Candidatus Dependentiae bacterium]|nr:30S ribosomal protein S16 [Candidatus Dependentiae bacterium]
MAVKIRLSRIGKKHAPFYQIVAVDSRKKRDGQHLENLGTYNPLSNQFVQFHEERINYWLSVGAVPTDAVVKLHRNFKALSATK